MPKILLSVMLVSAMLLSGCSSASKRAGYTLPQRPREAVRIFDREGRPAGWEIMRGEIADADVIVIGETHGHPLGLEAAACLWDDLLATEPNAALALEFFERDEQVAIDDYLSGVIEKEEDFRKASDRTPGNYPEGHRRMVESAKAAHRPVIAANAPRRYVRRAGAEGYEKVSGLSAEQKRLFALPDPLVEGAYRERFNELMAEGGHGSDEHGMSQEMIDRMYHSQQMWDATMADSIVRAVRAGYRPVVLVVGRFHSDFDGGTVQLMRRAEPDLRIRTLSMVASDAEAIEEDDVGRADYVVYVGKAPER